jgi:hypothetical protein
MNFQTLLALVKRSPDAAALVKRELAKRIPEPADLNARLLAARRSESTSERADRLAGHFRDAARPVSEAPAPPRVAAAGEVAAPPSINDRILQQRKGA